MKLSAIASSSALLGLVFGAACAGGAFPAGRGGESCYVDGDCPTGLACVDMICQEPSAAAMGEDENDDGNPDDSSDDAADDGADDAADDGAADDDDGDDDGSLPDDGIDDLPDGDGDDGSDDDPGECLDEGVTCQESSDCCGYSDDPMVGDGVCISDAGEGTVECTSWCDGHGDCASDCCASVQDSELGACIAAEACEDFHECVDGVSLFCTCEILAGGDCTDAEIQQYVSACSAGTGVAYFECMAPFYVDSEDVDVLEGACADAQPVCGSGPSSSSGGAPATFEIDSFAASNKLPRITADLQAR